MILDTVGVANMDEVNLSDMIVSGVIFSKFTSLGHTQFLDSTLKTCKYLSIPGHIVLLESLSRLTFSRLRNENENVSSFYFVNISLNSIYSCDLKYP